MKLPLPRWVIIWLVLTTGIVIWDALWILFARHHIDREESPFRGTANLLWSPYRLYITVDKRYGDYQDGFVVAQSCVNLAELVVGLVALYQNYHRHQIATLCAFISSFATFLKTLIYFGCEIYSTPKWVFTGHNSDFDFYLLFVLPSSFWLVIPGLISVVLGSHLFEFLDPNLHQHNLDEEPHDSSPHRSNLDLDVTQRLHYLDQLVKSSLEEILQLSS